MTFKGVSGTSGSGFLSKNFAWNVASLTQVLIFSAVHFSAAPPLRHKLLVVNKGPLRPFTSIHRPDLLDPWPFPIHSISFLAWGWDQGPGDWQPSWGHAHLGLLLANDWAPWKHWSWEIPARCGTSPMGNLCLGTLRRPGPSFSELHRRGLRALPVHVYPLPFILHRPFP